MIDPGLGNPRALAPVGIAAVIGGAWLFGVGHAVFLGVGMDLPGALALIGLLTLMLVRSLPPSDGVAGSRSALKSRGEYQWMNNSSPSCCNRRGAPFSFGPSTT